MKPPTEEEQKTAVLNQVRGNHRKALSNLDKLCDLENRKARSRGEKPPHPGRAKRKATGYLFEKFDVKPLPES
jgi:hypothetical protein